jgi:hypothetical protein
MKSIVTTALVLAASAAAATFTVTDRIDAANAVTPTKDDCATAWAILMSSDPKLSTAWPNADYKEAIGHVVAANPHWTAGAYEAGVSQKFDLQTFSTRYHEGGTSYVAHCGHGATCNALAAAVLKTYPEAGSPVVYCMVEPPTVLDNPQSF